MNFLLQKIWPFAVVAFSSYGFAAVEWVPQCADNGFSLIKDSEHFEVCKKPTTDQGAANNVVISESDAEGLLNSLEKVYSFYIDSLGWMLPFPGSPEKKLKSNIYVYENSVMSALYGGQDFVKGIGNEYGPGMWIGVGSLKDYWGTSHEFAHGLQGVAGWMGNNSHAGWMAESHANWMAHQYNSKDAHCAEMLINYPYLYYGSTRDRYCNWQFLEHLKEEFGGGYAGVKEVNRIWMESIHDGEEGRMEQTPFTAMMKVYNWSLEDLNREFGKFAMKNATLEYAPEKKKLYRESWGDYEFKTRRTTDGGGDLYRRHGRVTMLNLVSDFEDKGFLDTLAKVGEHYDVPSYWAPQRYGYNIVRIYPDSAGKVTVKFRGVMQHNKAVEGYKCFGDNSDDYLGKHYDWCNYAPDKLPDPASQWAVGLVAEGADGTPRYSKMLLDTAGKLSIDVKGDDKALWLTVAATPSEMQTILWDQFYYSIYRYPYMIRIENGKPEGYQEGAWKPSGFVAGEGGKEDSAPGYARHKNGGGLVSDKAKVDETVYVGYDAVVNGGTITGNARIYDKVVVDGGTISGNALVYGRALVSGGTISDDAVLRDDAWLVSGSISGNAQVGALSVIVNSTIKDDAQVYGVMAAVNGKTLSGTAQLRGDLENNFDKEITKGVFYGMVNTDMLTNPNFGADLTKPPVSATPEYLSNRWYEVDEDSADIDVEPPIDIGGVVENPSDDSIPDTLDNVALRALSVFQSEGELRVFNLRGEALGHVRRLDNISDNLKNAGFEPGVYLLLDVKTRKSRVFYLNK